MARPVSRGEIKQRALALADAVNDANVTDAWLNQLFNMHAPAVYEFCVEAGDRDMHVATMTPSITTSYGVNPYQLPQNFHAVTGAFVVVAGRRRPLTSVNGREKGRYRWPSQPYTVEVEYVPSCPVFSSDDQTVDGIMGWEELIVAKLARDVLIKRGADRTVVLDIIAGVEERIRKHAGKRDRGPRYVVDVEDAGWGPHTSTSLTGYRIVGSNIELFETTLGVWT